MPDDLLLIVHTARHRYIVRRDDVFEIKLIPSASEMPLDDRGRPYIGVELGQLLDPADCSAAQRRRALVVPLRRRLIAILADQIDALETAAQLQPLPDLLRARLSQPWAIGALQLEQDVIIQIDLRAVARSALAQSSSN